MNAHEACVFYFSGDIAMNIIRTDRLSLIQREKVCRLLEECRNGENAAPFFPLEDGDLFYLLFMDTKELACAAALSFFADPAVSYAECTAFTRPDLRRNGYFSALFERLSQDIEDMDLYFPVSAPCEGTLAALASLEAVHDGDEYKMELELDKTDKKEGAKAGAEETGDRTAKPAASGRLGVRWEDMGDGSFLLSFYLKKGKERPCPSSLRAGSCCLFFSSDSACFYGFEIKESLRGQGLGKEALLLTLSLLEGGLPVPGCKRIFLHVSGLNTAAVSLYRKAGFQISEILSYYLY